MMHYLSSLRKERLPFVLLGKPPAGENLCHVDNDNVNTSRRIVENFFRMGLSRIALIMDTPSTDTVNFDYVEGYSIAHHEHQKRYNENLIIHGEHNKNDIEGFKSLIEELKADSIILVGSNSEIRNYCFYQEERTKPLPVVCFSLDLYMEFYPNKQALHHIWYVDSNAYYLGKNAAEMLLRIIAGATPEKGQLLSQQLHRLDEGG
jgi:DNA-binding LacI/PurR family transcriptional regulator